MCPSPGGLKTRCSGLDPTEDTESEVEPDVLLAFVAVAVGSIRPRILKVSRASGLGQADRSSCSGLDPTEDTESPSVPASVSATRHVAVGSIRPRILKVSPDDHHDLPVLLVAVGSIRPRILKGQVVSLIREPRPGCSGLDPTEDTESFGWPCMMASPRCCSGLDPTEDTERLMRAESAA